MSEIDTFIDYFKNQIKEIDTLSNELYKKILFSCLLDTISRARFAKHNNEKRFLSFLLTCSNYNDFQRVSLFQLKFHLEELLNEKEKKKSKLFSDILEKIKNLDYGKTYRGHEIDPLYNHLEKKTTNSKEKKALKLARYVNLFYAYRNELVHGFREPGYPMEILSDDKTNPFYHGYINEKEHKELVFPIGFFKNLCVKCLENLESYLKKHNIDIDDIYKFSPMWTIKRKLRYKKQNIVKKITGFFKNIFRS